MVSMSKDDAIQIERLELEPFGTNAYVLVCRLTRESVLVDAPAQASKIVEFAVFSSKPHDTNLCGDVLWLSS